MKPHVHLSAIHGVAAILLMVIFFGIMRLLAINYPDNKFWNTWITLYG